MLDIICTRKEKTRVILFFAIYKMMLIIFKSENCSYPSFFFFVIELILNSFTDQYEASRSTRSSISNTNDDILNMPVVSGASSFRYSRGRATVLWPGAIWSIRERRLILIIKKKKKKKNDKKKDVARIPNR